MSNNTSDVPETCLLIEGGDYNTKNVDKYVRVVNPSLKSNIHVLKAPNSYEKFLFFSCFFFFA
jgi:hypothetical protein